MLVVVHVAAAEEPTGAEERPARCCTSAQAATPPGRVHPDHGHAGCHQVVYSCNGSCHVRCKSGLVVQGACQGSGTYSHRGWSSRSSIKIPNGDPKAFNSGSVSRNQQQLNSYQPRASVLSGAPVSTAR